MKIEHAYSTDLNEVVDIDTAYELFFAGRIRDKHHFLCLHEGCEGSITAANLDKLRGDMAMDPHFRRVQEETHTPACLLASSQNAAGAESSEEPAVGRGKKSDALADQFYLERPQSHYVAVQLIDEHASDNASGKRRRRKGPTDPNGTRAATSYSVGSLVSRFDKYRRLGIADEKHLQIKGFQLSYAEMFTKLNAQDVETLPHYPRIYFGRAYVDEKADGYRIGFIDSLVLNEARLRPSLYISRQQINDAFSRKLCEAKFKELSRTARPSAWFFVYGIPVASIKEKKTYLNFRVKNLDFLEFREGFEYEA